MDGRLESGIHFVTVGEDEPVVFVNGLFQSTESWQGFIPSLSRYYQVIVYDMANQGKSYRDEQISIRKHASDLLKLLQHFGHEKYFLIGHSYGCRVISELAKTHSDRIRKAILTATSTKSMMTRNKRIYETWYSVLELARRENRDIGELFANLIVPFIYSPAFIHANQAFINHFVNTIKQLQLEGVSHNLRALLDHINQDEVMRSPASFGVPTLIIQGREDYLTPSSLLEMDGHPGETIKIVPDCGHALTVEARDLMIQNIVEFFDEG
ncbi:alpha/beta fold hydrolase [Cohnella laeviribosi]|uniref:alpha/beta fold hydrolase n=1 Tax=Cohnella laeviribosi TaxID=380174 RepID=UPI000368B577|nr:alpha/beta hydrolase [Cohnella laeviribosi]